MVKTTARPERFTLANVISSRAQIESEWQDHNFILTDEEKESFCRIVGFGCQEDTKTILRTFIENANMYTNKGFSAFERVVFKNNRCTVIDHQSTGDMKRAVVKSIKAQY